MRPTSPATSRSDHPSPGASGSRRRDPSLGPAVEEIAQRAGEPGEPDRVRRRDHHEPFGTLEGGHCHVVPCGTGERVEPARSAGRSRCRPRPARRARRPPQQLVERLGPHLGPAVRPGQPGEQPEPWSHLRASPASRPASSWPALASRAADSSPETSSSTARCWPTAPPYGSASRRVTRRRHRPRRSDPGRHRRPPRRSGGPPDRDEVPGPDATASSAPPGVRGGVASRRGAAIGRSSSAVASTCSRQRADRLGGENPAAPMPKQPGAGGQLVLRERPTRRRGR